ncbi:hypothetical protein LCGC14_0273450 [marine sediment metagenome]|uniref:Tail tube protein n=2 Tax=root TaxID=1 RepID=A0A9C9NJN8_9HYPH|nr:hypothetical protein [Aurantimonas coralicida]
MSWTFTNFQTGLTITVRNPEPGDTHRFERRQASGETEGGRQFTQDLGITDEFLEGSWAALSRCEKDDLLRFFESVKYRALSFRLATTDGGAHIPFGFNPANSINRVRLDQSRLEFRHILNDAARRGVDERFETTMRFRFVPLPTVEVSDVIDIADNVIIAFNDVLQASANDSVSVNDSVVSAVLS